jgi:hypothetical protein
MADIPGYSVKRGDQQNVKSASPSVCHQLIESRSLRFRTRDYIRVLADNFESALLCQLAQVQLLGFKVLVSSAYSAINCYSLRHFNSFFLDSK